MSQNEKTFQLPYLLRDMLRFEEGARFELVLSYRSFTTNTIAIVGATREGIFKYNITPTISTTTQTLRFNIPDIPIWVSVIDSKELIEGRAIYASLNLAVNSDIVHALFSGYVGTSQPLTWPAISTEISVPNKGIIASTSFANPAAGSEIGIAVPNGTTWRFIGLTFPLVTNAAVANRIVHLIFTIAGQPINRFISSYTQTASLTREYTCMPTTGAGTLVEGTYVLIPTRDDIILPAGSEIVTETTGLQGGDDFGIPVVTYEKFIQLIP